MGSPASPVLAKIYMEYIKEVTFRNGNRKANIIAEIDK